MSSYFDEMTRRINAAQEIGSTAEAARLVKSVIERVRNYLTYLETKALRSEQPKVAALKQQFERLLKKVADSPSLDPVWLIGGEFHELGHDIGRAGIKLRGGARALDNPYFPGHYDID